MRQEYGKIPFDKAERILKMKNLFTKADILLPNTEATNMTKWSLIACDQYTSEPEYWETAKHLTKGSVSTLDLFLPEIYLSESESAIPKINAKMKEYVKNVLVEHKLSMIYLKRTIPDGRVREGIVGKVDLEAYDYKKGSDAPVRATEQTVIERIPPRVAIRRDAEIELPHIMMLCDDSKDILFSTLRKNEGSYKKAYDFTLMQGAGKISGYFISDGDADFVSRFIDEKSEGGLALCVGDGNHSLASAKALYEEIKAEIGNERAASHPSRYALCEIVNIHSQALDFEPIHRVIDDCDPESLLSYFKENFTGKGEAHTLRIIAEGKEKEIQLDKNEAGISVDPLQKLLDKYLECHSGNIDYIHGDSSLVKLSQKKGSVGIFCEPISKQGLFDAVKEGGSLPRKTFSMGVAKEKRHYLEARRIK